MKKLVLSYGLSWRTPEDKRFLKRNEWKKRIRPKILERDNYTCQYCGFKSEKEIQINHINGEPKDNSDGNLETICRACHKITHSGFWCTKVKIMDVYAKSNYSQNEIIQHTRKMREQGIQDKEIINFLGLKEPVCWKQDLNYLSKMFGFISSRNPFPSKPVTISEKEQQYAITNRNKW